MSNDQYNLNGYQLVRALYYFTADFRWISDARVGIDRATSQPANEPTSQPTYQQHQLIASATVWKIVMSFPIGYAISYLIYCLEEKINESIGESLEVVDTLPALGSYPQLCLSIVDIEFYGGREMLTSNATVQSILVDTECLLYHHNTTYSNV